MQSAHAAEDAQREDHTEGEGIIVWDQKGLVVRWADGHCSRFPWEVLRRACGCPACHSLRDAHGVRPDMPPVEQREWRLL
jgi:hypothetical protein